MRQERTGSLLPIGSCSYYSPTNTQHLGTSPLREPKKNKLRDIFFSLCVCVVFQSGLRGQRSSVKETPRRRTGKKPKVSRRGSRLLYSVPHVGGGETKKNGGGLFGFLRLAKKLKPEAGGDLLRKYPPMARLRLNSRAVGGSPIPAVPSSQLDGLLQYLYSLCHSPRKTMKKLPVFFPKQDHVC